MTAEERMDRERALLAACYTPARARRVELCALSDDAVSVRLDGREVALLPPMPELDPVRPPRLIIATIGEWRAELNQAVEQAMEELVRRASAQAEIECA